MILCQNSCWSLTWLVDFCLLVVFLWSSIHTDCISSFSVAVIPQPEATNRTKSVLEFIIPDRWVCHAREAWEQAAGMVTGTESGDLTYQPQTQSIVCKQEVGRVSSKLTNPTPTQWHTFSYKAIASKPPPKGPTIGRNVFRYGNLG